MLKIKIKLESLLYNNDNKALSDLKKLNINTDDYDKEIVKDIVNEIELDVRDDYSIDYLLKKLSRTLFDKIDGYKRDKNLNTCVYCFADGDRKNPENKNKIIIIDQNANPVNEIETQEHLDNMDIDEFEGSDIVITDDEDYDDSDDSSLSLVSANYGAGIGGGQNGNKIFICNNCKKVYFFDKYSDWRQGDYENFKGIFPFPELIYLRNNEKKLSFNLIDNQRKEISYIYNGKSILSSYDNIKDINRQFFKQDKKNTLYKYLDSISLNDGKEYRYIYNTSYMLLKNFNYENLTMSYFPEMCLYRKNNRLKSIEIYSKLYYPNVNFANYYLKFLDNIPKDQYSETLLRSIQLNQRKINDNLDIYTISQIHEENYGKYQGKEEEDGFYEGWGPDIENKEKIDDNFDKIDIKELSINKYINKINYKINSSRETNSLINFSLIFHLFELNEDTPFISSYLPEEGVMLEKYYRPLKEEIETLKLVVKNKKIIRFLTLLPEEIFGEKKYFYFHLYENLKIEITIVISNEKKIYINQEQLLLINNKVNQLIKKLNKLNIFNFSDIKIPLSNEKFENWNKNEKKTDINSINLNFEISSPVINDIHNKINRLSKCFNNYFIRDFNYNNNQNDFRYIKINNINLGVLTDRYIYFKIENIRELDTNNSKTDEEIADILIHYIMKDFQKNFFEAKNIYKNYLGRYKHFDNKIVPINYGVFFNIKKNEEDTKDTTYIVNVFGLRDYNDIKNIENFIKKMFYILNNPNDKNVKEISKICGDINKKKGNDLQILSKQNLILLNQKYRKCINQYNQLNYFKKNLKNDKKEIEKINKSMKNIKKIKEKIYKKIQKKEETTKHIKALKQLQNVFNNLKYNSCSDKNIKQYTKRCQAQKQPMGTGSGTYEEVIDFNKDYEQNRFKNLDKIECSIDGPDIQIGGSKDLGNFTYLDYCNYWNSKYTLGDPKKYKNYQDCYLEITNHSAKGKKNIQKLASEVYEIDAEQKQIKVVLKDIHDKILENLVNETNYKEYYEKIKNIQENGKNLIDFIKEYYSNDLLQTYNLNDKENFHKLSEYLFSQKFSTKYQLFRNIIIELNNPEKSILKGIKMPKIINLIVQKFNLTKLILDGSLNDNYKHLSIKKLIIYIINKIFKIKNIEINELKKISEYLEDNITLDNFHIRNQQFHDTFLIFNSKKFIENDDDDDDKKKINETSLKQLRSEITDLIIRTDPKTNEIINSTINFKGKALTCPNYSEKKDNVKIKPLIGFLDISKYSNKDNLPDTKIRDLVCQPCCFGQKYNKKDNDHIIDKRYRKNMLFCKNKINWKTYLKLIENETRIDGYIYSEALNVNTTFGMLYKPLYNLFNNFVFLLNKRKNLNYENFLFQQYNNSNRVLKKYGFCKKGYDQKKNVILSILEDILNLKKNIIINKIKKKLNDKPEIFKILNEGKLNILFKSIDNYINYLKSDKIDINWIVDILKYPGIFENYNKGINIILFKKINEDDEDSDINIVKYNFIDMIDYFDSNKNIIFLYKHFSGELEPIFLKKNKIHIGIFQKNMDNLDIFKNIQKNHPSIDINNYFENFINFFDNWINIIFKNNYFSAKKLIKKFKIQKQLVDKFYKVNYLIDDENNLIPVLPSEVDINTDFEIFNDFKYFEENNYLKDLKQTKNFMKIIKNQLNNEDYLYEKIILDKIKKNIIGIELRNNLIIPIIPIKYDESKRSRVSSKFLYYNINNILFNNEKIEEEIRFVKEKYDLEIYQRFILEFSNYLNNNRNDKLTLNEIINTDKKLFSNHIFDIVDKIISFKESQLINYRKINKQKNNQRILCDIDQNFYCDKNKLIIPFSKKNFLIGLFIESLINNEDFRLKVFNDKMNNIIDINKYIDDEKHIYKKKDFIF